jgi:hypothetical protein
VIDINIIEEAILKIIAFQNMRKSQQSNGIRGKGVSRRKKPDLESHRRIQGKNYKILSTIIIT